MQATLIDDLDLYPAWCSIDDKPATRARVALRAGRLRIWLQLGQTVHLLADQQTPVERQRGIVGPKYVAQLEGVGQVTLTGAGKPCGCGASSPLDHVDPNAG